MSKNLKAMVMAAGMGSRLEPITLKLPKPLIPVMNRPLMDIILSQLHNIGVNEVISNTYYLANQIIDRYKSNKLGIKFNYIKETELSGTAGGVKKCQFFFDEGEDFIVISGDVLTTADIKEGIEIHKKSGAIATIGVKQVPHELVSHFGVVVTDEKGYITEFQEKPPLEDAKSNLINTGIYIFNYKIFDFIPENTFYDFAKNVFPSIMDSGLKINTYTHMGYWSDIGSIDQYKQSNIDILQNKVTSLNVDVQSSNSGIYISNESIIKDKTSKIEGACVFGKNCTLGKNTRIKNSILWDNVEVKDNIEIDNSIILPNVIVEENIKDSVVK